MKLLITLLYIFITSFHVAQACEVTLSWIPPTENTDGSDLTDLSHYVIAYGLDKDKPDRWAKATGTSKRLIFASDAADYYFVIRAYKYNGVKSYPSNRVSHACEYLSRPVAPILNK